MEAFSPLLELSSRPNLLKQSTLKTVLYTSKFKIKPLNMDVVFSHIGFFTSCSTEYKKKSSFSKVGLSVRHFYVKKSTGISFWEKPALMIHLSQPRSSAPKRSINCGSQWFTGSLSTCATHLPTHPSLALTGNTFLVTSPDRLRTYPSNTGYRSREPWC